MNIIGPAFVASTLSDGTRAVTYNGAPLNMRLDLRNHSPDGPNWGYGGSGPAQLALAICAAAFGDDELALALYQDYKWHLIATIAVDNWILLASEVIAWANHHDIGRSMIGRN